jgi:hypothetical protein
MINKMRYLNNQIAELRVLINATSDTKVQNSAGITEFWMNSAGKNKILLRILVLTLEWSSSYALITKFKMLLE